MPDHPFHESPGVETVHGQKTPLIDAVRHNTYLPLRQSVDIDKNPTCVLRHCVYLVSASGRSTV
jgi:hypothetical protein